MYVAVGTPRVLTSRTINEHGGGFHHLNTAENKPLELTHKNIIQISKSPSTPHFCSITTNSISIWLTRPEIQLSTVLRDAKNIEEDGTNTKIVWKEDGSKVVVITSKGFVHFYDVIKDPNTEMLEYVFNSQFASYMNLEFKDLKTTYLRFVLALDMGSKLSCCLALEGHLLIATSEPRSIVALDYTGEAIHNRTKLLSDLEFLEQGHDLVDIQYSKKLDLYCFVCNGKVYLTDLIVNDQVYTWKGKIIYENNATTVMFNTKYKCVAIGNAHGTVVLLDVNPQKSKLQTKLSSELSLNKRAGKKEIVVGRVSQLSWSTDGYALACGWIDGGFSVWSIYGGLLSSTISEDTFIHTSDGIIRDSEELFFSGISSLFWSPNSYYLFLLPYSTQDVLDIFVMEFAHSSILTSLSVLESRIVSLICSDRLLIYDGINKDDSVAVGMDPLDWIQIQVPIVYISNNWPIRLAVANKSGTAIAVAGRRGLAHYCMIYEKWKLFGSEQEEQAFEVTAIVWFGTYLIVACNIIKTSTTEIRVYAKDNKLDDAHLLHCERMTHRVRMMNLTSKSLLVFCENGVLYSYFLFVAHNNTKILFQLKQAFTLEGFIGKDFDEMQAVCRFRATNEETTSEGIVNDESPVIILRSGTLHLIWKKDEGWFAKRLAGRVEHFWLAQGRIANSELQRSVWVFDGQGVKILRDPSILIEGSPSSKIRDESVIEIPLDFTPLSVLLNQGLIVGVKQYISLNNTMQISNFSADIQTTLFVHLIIIKYLALGQVSRALSFSQTYSNLPYFNHALEIMLHKALDDYSDNCNETSTLNLKTSIKFINQFPRSLEIIVNCARKSEMAIWKEFFEFVGDPKDLYHRALQAKAYNIATSYLIIIQTLEPVHVSSKLAIELLEKTLESDDFATGAELYRFLKSIFEGANSPEDPDPVTEEDKENMVKEANQILFKSIVHRKAKSLMLLFKFRDFISFAGMFGIPTAKFLADERKAILTIFESWDSVFSNLHEQFSWPLPLKPKASSNMPAKLISSMSETNLMVPRPSYRNSNASFVPPPKLLSKREQDLNTFLKACKEAQLLELSLLLATMLLDKQRCVSVIEKSAELIEPWKKAVESMRNSVYIQFCEQCIESYEK